jgi:thioredoxin 1
MYITMPDTITTIENLKEFNDLLIINPGLLIIKFGAEWCGPCKKVENDVRMWFERMPDNVQTVMLDIDESFELYAYLKNKKMLKGIPAILMYKKGNNSYIFDDAVNTSNLDEIHDFFNRCMKNATL